MKQSLQLRVSQHLALTPQLQQSIRLLQLSTLELHQELEQILSENPMLERIDDPLDKSVRLLADGGISPSTISANGDASAQTGTLSPAAEEADGGFDATPDASPASDNDWSFDDVARTSKASEEEDARPQLEAHQTTLREHLLEQMRVTVREQRDRA